MLAIKAPELPGYKLGIIKTVNLLKSFKPQGDTKYTLKPTLHLRSIAPNLSKEFEF